MNKQIQGYDVAQRFYTQDVNGGALVKACVDFWKPFMLNTPQACGV